MSHAAPAGVRDALRRAAALVLLCLALVVPAGPAAAHGGGDVADGSNYHSRIAGVDPATGAPADGGALRWRVLANDALLELRDDGDTEVVVAGYEGEPYLRVGPDGVFENVAPPPPSPRRPLRARHDPSRGVRHRGAALGAAQRRAPWRWHGPPHPLDGHHCSTSGQGRFWSCSRGSGLAGPLHRGRRAPKPHRHPWWVPAPSPWPWLATAVLAMALPLAVAARRAPPGLLGAAAGLSAAVGLLTVARALDDVLAFPAPGGADAVVLARACLLALPALAAVPWVRRAGDGGALAVAAGSALLALGNAPQALALLSASQVASAAPAAARLITVLVLALALPTVVALLVALRTREPRTRRELHQAVEGPATTSTPAPDEALPPPGRR